MVLLALADLEKIWEGKKAKLQIQYAEMEQPSTTDDMSKSQILKGIAIYVSTVYT